MMKPAIYILLILSFIVLFCAKQGMPPGGPEDKTPPRILLTVPVTGDTLVDRNVEVQAWFSEAINPATASDAVFITPYPGENVGIKWGGRRVRIRFPASLKPDRTYVVTLGTGIKDFRNNPLEASYILAFSTGSVLDQGEISGRVYSEGDASGIGVWAYPLTDSTLYDPARVSPEYIVQCDKDGAFRFSHIAPGEYRLLAVRDRLADRLYQRVEDEVGVTARDVRLSREGPLRADSLFFLMSVEDTVGPSLMRAVASSPGTLQLNFDEPVSPYRTFSPEDVSIVAESDSTDTLRVARLFVDPLNGQVLHLETEPMQSEMQYVVVADGITDSEGNGVDPEYGRKTFASRTEPDTTHPFLLLVEPAPGTRSVERASGVRLVFNEPMDSIRFSEGFFLTDTLGSAISGISSRPSPMEFLFQPTDSLKSRTVYLAGLQDSIVQDMHGNAVGDTTYQFSTLNADTLSEISGQVVDLNSEGRGNLHVGARHLEDEGSVYSQVLPGPEAYRFRGVLPGQYVLDVFRDRDGNGRYSYGRPFPYEPAERFVVYEDTVAVRSRWPNEGNTIILR